MFSSDSRAVSFARSFFWLGFVFWLLLCSAPLLLGAPQRFSVGVVASPRRSGKDVYVEEVPLVEEAVAPIWVYKARSIKHPCGGTFVTFPLAVDSMDGPLIGFKEGDEILVIPFGWTSLEFKMSTSLAIAGGITAVSAKVSGTSCAEPNG